MCSPLLPKSRVLCGLMLMMMARLARRKRRTDVRQLNDGSEMLARWPVARNAEVAIPNANWTRDL